ncbi:MAG: ASCH domain-containing protein [Acidimicrobiales bacterium]
MTALGPIDTDAVARFWQRYMATPEGAAATPFVEAPTAGSNSVVCEGGGSPRAVIRTTDVRIGPLSSVDDQFAWDEGEGDRSRDHWLAAHTDYFTRSHERLGAEMHADIPVVFERFDLVYAEPGPSV